MGGIPVKYSSCSRLDVSGERSLVIHADLRDPPEPSLRLSHRDGEIRERFGTWCRRVMLG